MKLIIGGLAQGKLHYVLQKEGNEKSMIFDGELAGKRTPEELEAYVMEFVEKHPDVILICDEIGNGIVPVDAFERTYREQTGRILIRLAQKADEVVRVLCGIGQRIK